MDDNEVVKTRYNYSPFGVTEIAGEASDNPFMFTGRELDDTGLYYYRARYYSPDMGRFISEDPIGFEGGDVNFYRYVVNNPVNFNDPRGLDSPIGPIRHLIEGPPLSQISIALNATGLWLDSVLLRRSKIIIFNYVVTSVNPSVVTLDILMLLQQVYVPHVL